MQPKAEQEPAAHADTDHGPAASAPAARSGRRAIWLAVAVAIVWLIIGSVAGPLSGKLSEVQKNDNTSFLPASAESTKVAEEQAKFADVNSLPILVVVSNADGSKLTGEQIAEAGQYAAKIPDLPIEGGGTLSEYLVPGPVVAIPSQDSQAVLLVVSLDADKAAANLPSGEPLLPAAIAAIREGGAEYPNVQINVAGPGGILADLFKVFGGIDTTLLGATALVVAIILILVYRSPFIWLIPLLSSAMALSAASAVVYLLAKNDIVVLNGQSQGILTVLVFGAGTDYALLLVARYREELHRFASHTQAMRAALRGVVEPIVASAATVCLGLLCLLLSELNSNRSLGPVSAAGILAALVVMLTFLPALLVIPSVVIPVLAFIVPALIGLVLSLVSDISAGPFVAIGGMFAAASVVAWIFFGVMRIRKPEWGPFSRTKFPPAVGRSGPRFPSPAARTRSGKACGRGSRAPWASTAGSSGWSLRSSCWALLPSPRL